MNLCRPGRRPAVLANLVRTCATRGNALTAGDVGYRYLLRALADGGRSDVIFDMNNQSDKPGYGYQLAHGATSLTEAWDADRVRVAESFHARADQRMVLPRSRRHRAIRPGRASRRSSSGEQDFLLDGQRLQIRCGEIHFARVPREYWRHRLQCAAPWA
jgi:hypothetical protein